mmetsp:Transcript_34767/g.59045  ORF Transcript_34767/g.59045 Transcript_34767/m.59045 type:complete len:308 (-) Transcript_34767:134-1057(-)
MSNPFGGSSNLFGNAANSSSASAPSYAPALGLRQRHSSSVANGGNVGASRGDENSNPNSNSRDATQTNYGKWGSMSKVPAPPRMSLATAGKSTIQSRRTVATAQQQQQAPAGNKSSAESDQRALARVNEQEDEDLSRWVVGYGYRNKTHFRALYHRLENCGVITARRGGLACFGEATTDEDADNGSNWVAVQFENALYAQKALCQRGNIVNIGGSTMVIGVMPLTELDAAAKLGIHVNKSMSSQEIVNLSSGSYSNNSRRGGLRTEANDAMIYECEGDGIVDGEMRSGMDSLCEKVLAWFFMWDTHR